MGGGRAEPETSPEAALREVWAALGAHYPMLEYAGAVGDGWLAEALPRVRSAASLAEAFPLLGELVGRLQDYHTRLDWPGRVPLAAPPGVELTVADGVLAVLRAPEGSGLRPGDRVLAVDGVEAAAALAAALGAARAATPDARRAAACRGLLQGTAGTECRLRTERGEVALPRGAEPRSPGPRPAPELRIPPPGDAGLLRIAAWGGLTAAEFTTRLDGALERARELPLLVIDVRGNGGGADALADACTGRFIERPVISSISFWRQPGTTTFERSVEHCQPRGPWRYSGRVAVLIDAGCASACEHFVSGMDASAAACLVGLPTTGACGLSRSLPLRCGATLHCALTFPLHGGVPSPLHGIEPHIRVEPSLADLRAGRDGALEVALAWLRGGGGVPETRNTVWAGGPGT